jgi:hypothetical protein
MARDEVGQELVYLTGVARICTQRWIALDTDSTELHRHGFIAPIAVAQRYGRIAEGGKNIKSLAILCVIFVPLR